LHKFPPLWFFDHEKSKYLENFAFISKSFLLTICQLNVWENVRENQAFLNIQCQLPSVMPNEDLPHSLRQNFLITILFFKMDQWCKG
jgi:hypothetical protein